MGAYKPYSLWTPEFETTSGGIRVMWGLFGWLLAKGQVAITNGKWNNEFVAIYPEIVNGNPLEGTKVIRYILQTPGVMANYGVPGPSTEEIKATSDDVYVFSRIYDTFGVDDNHILFLPIINLHLFYDQGRKRNKTCYLVGKGVNQNKHPEDSIELTRDFASDQKALSNLLNECHTFYCYDRLSAMMEVARLCGVRVQYYGGMDLSLYEPGTNGIDSDLDVKKFREHYKGLIKTFEKRLHIFIAATQL